MMVKDELEKVKEWHRRCAVSRRGRRGAIVEVIWIMCFCLIGNFHASRTSPETFIYNIYIINGHYLKSVPSILWLPWKLAPHSPGLKLSVQNNSIRFWWLGEDEVHLLVIIYTIHVYLVLPTSLEWLWLWWPRSQWKIPFLFYIVVG